jgi:molybdopterin molybdotransferase
MGQAAAAGDVAIARGRRFGPPEIALAALLGVQRLEVLRRPDVALVIAGPKPPAVEAVATALSCLITRDGGVARVISAGKGGLAQGIQSSAGADIVLVVGGSGWGNDDTAARAIVAAGGRLDHHGLALTPGGSAGFGGLGDAPLLLLSGDPLAALVTYDLLAGRLVRHLAGRAHELPYPIRRFKLLRKITSPIGMSEWVPLRCHGSNVEPLPLPQADGLAGLPQADGFLIVPAGLEGYGSGESIDVYVTAEVSAVQEKP